MNSKISFFNKGLFFSNIKRFSWAAVLETVLMFFCFPFNLMTTDTGYYGYFDEVAGTDILFVRSYYTLLTSLTVCVYAVMLAVLLFHYLHRPKMTTALHGLPVSRTVLFGTTVLSGVALLVFPVLVNTALVALVNATMYIGIYIYMTSVLRWAVYTIVLSLVLFALSALIGMFVGNAAAQFVLTYIIHFLPLAIFGAIMALGQMFLLGFSTETDVPKWIMDLPMMTIAHTFTEPCGYYLLLYFIMTVVFLALALFAYKKRPLEQAGDIVVFNWVKPLFKYCVSVCFSVTGFLYIVGISGMETQNNLIGNTIVAMLWALVGFCVAQMLVAKTWRIFSAYKEMLAVCLAIGALFVLYQTDITGFEKRMPAQDSIASVEVGGFNMYPSGSIVFNEAENIELVTKMHKEMIAAGGEQYNGGYTRVEYTLKNGTKLYRAYGRNSNQVEAYFEELAKTQEAKQNGYFMFYENVDQIDNIMVNGEEKNYYILDINRLAEAIRADVNAWDTIRYYDSTELGVPKFDLSVEMKDSNAELYGRTHYFMDISQESMPLAYAVITEYAAQQQANVNVQTE